MIFSDIQEKTDIQNTEIWNGNLDIAHVVNQAGKMSSRYAVSKMFDSNPNTCWHSAGGNKNKLKIIGVQFNVSFCHNYFIEMLHIT